MRCGLDHKINECPFFDKENGLCNNLTKCTFQEEESIQIKNKYVRKERWYETMRRERREHINRQQ